MGRHFYRICTTDHYKAADVIIAALRIEGKKRQRATKCKPRMRLAPCILFLVALIKTVLTSYTKANQDVCMMRVRIQEVSIIYLKG